MKQIITILIVVLMLFNPTAYAIDSTEFKPNYSFANSLGRDVNIDLEYIKSIANLYSNRYVVREEKYLDITAIDEFYKSLSMPLTLEEIDSGQMDFKTSYIGEKEYQNNLKKFKVLGGLSGYKCKFEPIAFFSIYRDISLIGGYVKYEKKHIDPYEAYWQYVCSIEDMTKEIVPYYTRMELVSEIEKLSQFMDEDRNFKIFLLKGNEIDSMFECG
jgi:hypothetical protein